MTLTLTATTKRPAPARLVLNRATPVTRAGREYLVAPATMLLPGVVHGSLGPVLYGEQVLRASAPLWNDAPALLGHPADLSASARHPDVLEAQGLGRVYGVRYDRGLRGDVWVEAEAARRLYPGLVGTLLSGRLIEGSAGMGVVLDETPGVYQGVEYLASALAVTPDHYALLVDQPGACSVVDGCGVGNSSRAVASPWRKLRLSKGAWFTVPGRRRRKKGK